MRVNSHHISRDRKIKNIFILGAIALMLLFALPKAVLFVSSLVLSPVHAFQSWIYTSTDSFPYFVRDRSLLVDELNALKYSQSARSGDRLTSQMLADENARLKVLLSEKGEVRIVAGVIGRPHALPYDVLVLDKGSEDGITEGAPVYIGDNAVIGIIKKAFSGSSLVELVTTPGFKASVYILGPDIYTTAVGQGGGQLRVGVPQGIKLEEGNLVILPGVHAGIYGSISTVTSISTEPEQYGFVSPEIPLSSLRLVSVGKVPLLPITFEEAQDIVAEVQKTVFEVAVPDHVLVKPQDSTTTTAPSVVVPASTTSLNQTTTAAPHTRVP